MLSHKFTVLKGMLLFKNRKLLKHIFYCFIVTALIFPINSYAQNSFEKVLGSKMDSILSEKGHVVISQNMIPNNSLGSIMTPSGWGSYGTYLFGAVGGIYPAGYTNKADLLATAGITFGRPDKLASVSASVNIGRVSEFQDFSLNLTVSRKIFESSSVSVGGLQLFSNENISDAPYDTYFVAFSHAVQTIKPKRAGFSALSYTIGFGTGRFLLKSPYDVANGKGKYGTGIFGSISYEILKNVNINAEWSGLNLGFSTGFRPIKNSNLNFGVGIYNLTKYTGDRAGVIATIGLPISLEKNK